MLPAGNGIAVLNLFYHYAELLHAGNSQGNIRLRLQRRQQNNPGIAW